MQAVHEQSMQLVENLGVFDILSQCCIGLLIFVTSHGKTYTNGYPLKRGKRTAEKRV